MELLSKLNLDWLLKKKMMSILDVEMLSEELEKNKVLEIQM
jgi:hypothetical protein